MSADEPIISLLLPTRGRPILARRMLDSVLSQSRDASRVEIVLYVDDDDPGSHTIDHGYLRITKIIGPRVSMGTCNSACLTRARGQVIMLANDDMIIRTQGWDQRILDVHSRHPDQIYLAYGNDGFKKQHLATFPILSRRTCDLLVEPFPSVYRGAFIDYHLFDIFQRVQHAGFQRIHYLEDVLFEHMHYRTGKGKMDETYLQRGRFDDDFTFLSQVSRRRIAAARLICALTTQEMPLHQECAMSNFAADNLVSAVFYFSREILLDRGLPVRWRAFLWCWFIMRYVVSRTPISRLF